MFVDAGRTPTGRDAVGWAAEATAERGAGEVLLTSMDRDGTGDGYDLELLEAVRDATNVPLIASGGAGKPEHFADGLRVADAVSAASRFHDGDLTIAPGEGPPRRRRDRGAPMNLDELAFDERGLIPVIAQDAENGDVLMLAWANREALERTLEEGRMVYWSRSRRELWRKATQRPRPARPGAARRLRRGRRARPVHQEGAACHTGERTCFFRMLEADQN